MPYVPPTLDPLFVPCLDVGLGTGRAVVVDCVTRRPVRLNVESFALVGGVVCVRAEVVRRIGDQHLARFPGGQIAWVRPVTAAEAVA